MICYLSYMSILYMLYILLILYQFRYSSIFTLQLLSVNKKVSAETHYVIADDIIKSLHSAENLLVHVNMQDNLAAVVTTQYVPLKLCSH